MRKKAVSPDIPSLEQLESELNRLRYRSRYRSVLRSTVYSLIVVAAVAVQFLVPPWPPRLATYFLL